MPDFVNAPATLLASLHEASTLGPLVPVLDHALAPEVRRDPDGARVNLHPGRRLGAFASLAAVGLLDPETLADEGDLLRRYEERYQEEPVSDETPEERLARQWVERYPALRSREGEVARWLARWFLHEALVAVAAADAVGGVETRYPAEAGPRPLARTLDDGVAPEDLIDWLRCYPHSPLPDDAPEWLWSAEDPAIPELYRRLLKRIERDPDAFEADGSLRVAALLETIQSALPEYLPRYDALGSRLGGLTSGGLLLRQVDAWLRAGTFLGVKGATWEALAPDERVLLGALLLQRAPVADPTTLFAIACQLLLGPNVRVAVELYRRQTLALGTTLAQLGRTLALGGAVDLHAPQIRLELPWDRTSDPDVEAIEERLALLERLFVPAHLPLVLRWRIDGATLGRSAFLGACRLGHSPWEERQDNDGDDSFD